jgi:putative transcriptional regulator
MVKSYKSDVSAAIHEMASDLHEIGLLDKKTMREFDELCLTPVQKLTPAEIKAIREEAHASQTVFARHLNVSPLAISQWERGERAPSGSSLKLLTLVKNKGLGCIA